MKILPTENNWFIQLFGIWNNAARIFRIEKLFRCHQLRNKSKTEVSNWICQLYKWDLNMILVFFEHINSDSTYIIECRYERFQSANDFIIWQLICLQVQKRNAWRDNIKLLCSYWKKLNQVQRWKKTKFHLLRLGLV